MKVNLCPVMFLLNLLTVFGVPLFKENIKNNTWNQSTVDGHTTSFLHGVDRRDSQRVDRQCKYTISGVDEIIHTADRQFVRNFQIKQLVREQNITFLDDDLLLKQFSDSFKLLPVRNDNYIPNIIWKLWTKYCLQNRQIDTLLFSLSERLEPSSRCRLKNVTIRVVKPTVKLEPKPLLGIIDVDFGTNNPDSRIVTVLSISVGGCSSLACNVTNTGENDQFIVHRLDDRHILIETRVDKDSCNAVYNISARCSWQDKFSPFRTFSALDSYVVRFAGAFCSTSKSIFLPSVHMTPIDSTDNQTSTETSMAENLFTTEKTLPSVKLQQNHTAKQNTGFTDYATQTYISHSPSARQTSTKTVIIVQSGRIFTSRTISITKTNLSEIKVTPTHLKESGKTAGISERSDSSHETGVLETTLKRERQPPDATNEPVTTLHTPILYSNTDTEPSTTASHKTASPKNISTRREATIKNIFDTSTMIANPNTGTTNYGTQGYISNLPRVMHKPTSSTIIVQPMGVFRNRTARVTKSNLMEISLRPTLLKKSDKPGSKTERPVTTRDITQIVYSGLVHVSSHETGSVELTVVREGMSTIETSNPTTTQHTLILSFNTSNGPPSLAIHKWSSPKSISMHQEATFENLFEKSVKIAIISAVVCVILGVPLLVGLYHLIQKIVMDRQ